ncbi:MAG: glycosyltransferase family 4 protein [Deltaproteobacteria bacterium]|nr:MAG: glycosyltransferase family 4 protein [Deltaproteobacteria bacterium]
METARAVAADREPRLDVYELCRSLSADVLDFKDVDASRSALVRAAGRALGQSAALALLGAERAADYQAILTTGEDIGIPLAARLRFARRRPSHTMIAHTLSPLKKRLFFAMGRVEACIDRFLCYATSEERNLVERLSVPAERVERIAYHADQRFFRPFEAPPEPDLLPLRLRIAAGSPWIAKELKPGAPLPENVQWRRYSRFELRELYRRSAICIVPIQENDYQTGISTILEMMAMGKCVIATRTRGQTDTLVDGVNGIYVPPGDVAALRAAILRAVEHPEETARMGAAARRYIEEHATLDLFVDRVSAATLAGRTAARPAAVLR